MSDRVALQRLRIFLYLLAAGLYAGTVAELLMLKHYGSTIRLVPFVFCGLGLLALAAARVRPTEWVRRGAGAAMIVIALGSLLGVYEHIEGNLGFVREIHRHPTTHQLVMGALTGQAPLLAPGTFAIAAVISLAAMYASAKLADEARAPEKRAAAWKTSTSAG